MRKPRNEPAQKGKAALLARVRELESELAECQETLEAIRSGDFDAVVVKDRSGEIVPAATPRPEAWGRGITYHLARRNLAVNVRRTWL
jgi:hypothetical protein